MTDITISTEDIYIKASKPDEDASAIEVTLDSHDNYFGRVVIDDESAHRIGDMFHLMRRIGDQTVEQANLFYTILAELDADWLAEQKMTRQNFHFCLHPVKG